ALAARPVRSDVRRLAFDRRVVADRDQEDTTGRQTVMTLNERLLDLAVGEQMRNGIIARDHRGECIGANSAEVTKVGDGRTNGEPAALGFALESSNRGRGEVGGGDVI